MTPVDSKLNKQPEYFTVQLQPFPATDLLTTAEAGAYLRVSPATLVTQRSRGTSPVPFVKLGRKVLYRRADLDALVARGRVVQEVTAAK
jgi:excisionase family DNA binding protein